MTAYAHKKIAGPPLLWTDQPPWLDGARLFAVRRRINSHNPRFPLHSDRPYFVTCQLCYTHWNEPREIFRDCSQEEHDFWQSLGIPSLGDCIEPEE